MAPVAGGTPGATGTMMTATSLTAGARAGWLKAAGVRAVKTVAQTATAEDQVGYFGKKTNSQIDDPKSTLAAGSTSSPGTWTPWGTSITGKRTNMIYYETMKDVPEWYRPSVKKVVDKGGLRGTGDGLHVSDDMCRVYTSMDRMDMLG